MFSKMALGGIWAYQQYISPNKGFRCAYSVHHGGTGCSGYAKRAIRNRGLWRALPDIRQRFRDCHAAYDAIKDSCSCNAKPPETEDDQRPLYRKEREELERRRRKDNRCCSKGDMCIGCGEACGGGRAAGCGGSAGRTASSKTGLCDLNPCDGDIGCGGCDSCSCDVCSCG